MFKLISKLSKWAVMLIGIIIVLAFFALSIVGVLNNTGTLAFIDSLMLPSIPPPVIEPVAATPPVGPELWNIMVGHFRWLLTEPQSITFVTSMSIVVGIIFVIAPIAYRLNYKRDMRKIHALIGKSNSAVGKVVRSSRL